MKLYRRIRDLREDADLYQKQIAAILNCSQQTYSDYECGKTDVPTEVLIKLADYYDTTTDYILGRTNDRRGLKPYSHLIEKRQRHVPRPLFYDHF